MKMKVMTPRTSDVCAGHRVDLHDGGHLHVPKRQSRLKGRVTAPAKPSPSLWRATGLPHLAQTPPVFYSVSFASLLQRHDSQPNATALFSFWATVRAPDRNAGNFAT